MSSDPLLTSHQRWKWAGVTVDDLTQLAIHVTPTEAQGSLEPPDGWAGEVEVDLRIRTVLSIVVPAPKIHGTLKIRIHLHAGSGCVLRLSTRESRGLDFFEPQIELYVDDQSDRLSFARVVVLDNRSADSLQRICADDVTLKIRHPGLWTPNTAPEIELLRRGKVAMDPVVLMTPKPLPWRTSDLLATCIGVLGLTSSALAAFLMEFYSHFGISLSDVGLDAQGLAAMTLAVSFVPTLLAIGVYLATSLAVAHWPNLAPLRGLLAVNVGFVTLSVVLQRSVSPGEAPTTKLLLLVSVMLGLCSTALTGALAFPSLRKGSATGFRLSSIAGVVGAAVSVLFSGQVLASEIPFDMTSSFGPSAVRVTVFPGVPIIDIRPVEVTPIGGDARLAIELNHMVNYLEPSSSRLLPSSSAVRETGYCMGLIGMGGQVYTLIAQGLHSNGIPGQIFRIPSTSAVLREPLPHQLDDFCSLGRLIPPDDAPVDTSSTLPSPISSSAGGG